VRTATNLVTVARSDPANPRRTTVEAILASGGQACPLDDLARQIEAEPSIQRVMQWYESERASVCDGGDGAGRGEPTAAALSPNGVGAPATTGGDTIGDGGDTTGDGGIGVATGDGSNGDGSHGDDDTAVVAWQLTMAGVRSAPAG
jgi:hypothetical protein